MLNLCSQIIFNVKLSQIRCWFFLIYFLKIHTIVTRITHLANNYRKTLKLTFMNYFLY